MDERFVMPFQWEGGNFISPYLSTSDDTIGAVIAQCRSVLAAGAAATDGGSSALRPSIADVGCGDGRVVAAVCAACDMDGVGYDLDEELVDKAQEMFGRHSEGRLRFQACDVLTCAPQVFTRHTVLYFYLLDEALLAIRGHVEAATAHWGSGIAVADDGSTEDAVASLSRVRCVMSNRWPIPYLEKYLQPSVHPGLHVYLPSRNL
jgi:SAM-dependent methyltransferase